MIKKLRRRHLSLSMTMIWRRSKTWKICVQMTKASISMVHHQLNRTSITQFRYLRLSDLVSAVVSTLTPFNHSTVHQVAKIISSNVLELAMAKRLGLMMTWMSLRLN